MLTMEIGKREIAEGTGLPNQESMRMFEEEKILQILGNIRIRHHQTSRDKMKIKKKEPKTSWSSEVEISSKE